MRKTVVVTAVVLGVGLAAAGLVRAADEQGMDGHKEMMGRHHKMMGQHMMGMGLSPFSVPNATIKVTSTKTGAVIEVSATDPTDIARIQKKAQILQLMHELRALEPEKSQEESHEDHDSDQENQPAP